MAKRVPKLEIYEIRSGGAWNWRLKGANGENMARGAEARGFSSPAKAWQNVSKVRRYLGIEDFPMKMPRKGSSLLVKGLEILRHG